MGFDFTLNANHLDANTAPVLAPPFTMGGMVKTTKAQARRLITIYNRSDNTQFFALALDVTGNATGKFSGYIGSGATTQQVLAAAVDGTWMGSDVCFESSFTRSVMSSGGNKATITGTISPAGVNGIAISGRPSDHSFGAGGPEAHDYIYSRKLEDVERKFLQLGGARRAIKNLLCYWTLNRQSSGTVPDEMGVCTLTITGTMAASADNPKMQTYYKGAAISALVLQVSTAMTPTANLLTSIENVDSTVSFALMKVGASTASTTAGAPITTAPRVIAVNDVTIFAPGDYAQAGSATPSRVLQTFTGTAPAGTIVVADDQSFSTGATISRCPSATSSVAGISVNSSTGVISGTPTGTQSLTANYFVGISNTADPTNASLRWDTPLFPITVNALPVAPSFTSFPVATARADGNGFDVAFQTNTSCTAYGGAYATQAGGGTDPTISQLEAATGALSAANVAANGAAQLSLVGLAVPLSDLHFVLHNPQGDSSLYSLRSKLKGPPLGTQYRQFVEPIDTDTVYAGNVSTSDIEEGSATLTPSGAPIVLSPDGNDSFTASGRQRRSGRVWDASTNAWMLDSTSVQQFNVWYNNKAPVFVGGPSVLIVVDLNVPMTPFPLTTLFQSVDGAQQTVSALDSLPTGLSINGSSQLVGTPTVGGIYLGKRIRSTDLPKATADGAIAALIVGPIHPPNLFSYDYRAAITQLLASFLVPDVQFQDDDGAPGIVLSQDPGPTASVKPNSKVTIFVSQTPAGQVPNYGLRNHAFAVVPQADGDLDLNHPDGSG
jgi:hypothetical protein